VQKAVSLVSSLTIGSIAAVAPLMVFFMQMIEGRVDYSRMTSLGLSVYFFGAMLAALGSARAVAHQPEAFK
jgi:Na+/serine symporter